jgi:hypothetical protein
MLGVQIEYPDLSLPQRKGIAARHAVYLSTDAAIQQASRLEQLDIERERDAALTRITLPIKSQDDEPLDSFVMGVVHSIGVKPEGTPSCANCTGDAASICNGGTKDAHYLRGNGECVSALKEAARVAVATATKLYGLVHSGPHPSDVCVRFEVDKACPTKACTRFCVSGSSKYDDTSDAQRTQITFNMGLKHWTLESCTAFGLILAHELICHAGFGIATGSARSPTSATDRFIEGWMDQVARDALIEETDGASWPSAISRAIFDDVRSINGVLTDWRNSVSYSGNCGPKDDDDAARDRKAGAKQARALQRMFKKKGAETRFRSFSVALNAAGIPEALRGRLIEEVQVAVSTANSGEGALALALDRYLQNTDVSEFIGWLRSVDKES